MINEKIRIAALAGALLAATCGGAFAQTETTAPGATDTVTRVEAEDDGFDLGWLGLLGLLGLAGLSRRRDPVRTTTTTGTTGTRL